MVDYSVAAELVALAAVVIILYLHWNKFFAVSFAVAYKFKRAFAAARVRKLKADVALDMNGCIVYFDNLIAGLKKLRCLCLGVDRFDNG